MTQSHPQTDVHSSSGVRVLQLLSVVGCALVIIGMYTIPVLRTLSSIGIGLVTLAGLGYWALTRRFAQREKWPAYAAVALLFGLQLASGLNTDRENIDQYWKGVVLQLPFVLLPLAFGILPVPSDKQRVSLLALFVCVTALSALGSTIYYLFHTAEINELYTHSKLMPTVPDHVNFSLLVALAIATGVCVWERESLKRKGITWLIAGIAFLVFFQFLLAVRSGLLAFYLLSIGYGAVLLWRRQLQKAFALAGFLLLMPLMSYFCLPTFRNKYHNTQEDAGQISQSQEANRYSLVGRVYSYQAAWAIVKDNPIWGVGKADVHKEMSQRYHQLFPQITENNYNRPHNQYLEQLVSYGSVGLVVFLLGFYYPLWWARRQWSWLLMAYYVVITVSFMVNPMLESQIGTVIPAFFLAFLLWVLPARQEGESVVIAP
ncbi:O-antigen ligase family protein [Hymenobacter busanensis]|uniref:O-antigen ligase family protein n=1 Tax=Hymenobacter busanensis TaxID=2607656 RepID=A0A7L5A474_9BACT|nr:O-antigen ligase family protein [Hymenobacter busanensis]KAA9338669.1 O-antigen ligase family protein [Hymenobacter busanensis]QHJ08900.1 hypothetical protein GUY19_17055 [Hymenobacter busanensis]